MVHDAVDDRCGEFVVREDRAPFTELDVRGEYDAPSFVAARDDPVEQARPVDVEGYVAELVQYVFCFNVCSTGSAVFFRSVG